MDKSEHESDGELDNSQQIDGMNSDTRFPQTNEVLQSLESSISTIVSMKYASTDVSTNAFLKCVSTDLFINCISNNAFMSIPTGVIVLHTSIQNLLLQYLHKDVTMAVSLRPSQPLSL